METLLGKTVLITGAASGIGRETALAFAEEGCRLALWDIDGAGLRESVRSLEERGVECACYQVDVSDFEQVEKRAAQTLLDLGGVDVLVNNAGVCIVADIVDTPIEDWNWIVGVNLMGAVHTIHCFLPRMIDRGSGHIVNVSSGAGLFALAALGAYSTTKFALVGLSEALRQEVREHSIGVTAVCPGGTDTEIISHMRIHGYSEKKLERHVGPILKAHPPGARLAEKIVRAVKRDSPLVPTTAFTYFHYYLKRISPWLFRLTTRGGRRVLNRFFRP